MSIIGEMRDEMEYKMFLKLMEVIANNLETESWLLTAEPQTLFTMEVGKMIEKCADIFGYRHETAGKIFNEIMDKKDQICLNEQ